MCDWSPPPERLVLSPGSIQVWRFPVDLPPEVILAWQPILSPAELDRAARFRFERDRLRFIARRALSRFILSHYTGLPPVGLTFTYGEYGKPEMSSASASDSIHFNLSHSDGLCLLAVSQDHRLGVDLERIRPEEDFLDVAERYFSPVERRELAALPSNLRSMAFFTGWTSKEAFIKAVGVGLSLPLDSFDVSLHPHRPARLLAVRGLPDPGEWTLKDLNVSPDYRAAVCYSGANTTLCCWQLDDPAAWSASFRVK